MRWRLEGIGQRAPHRYAAGVAVADDPLAFIAAVV